MSTFAKTGVFKTVCTDELIVKGESNTDTKLTVTGNALSDLMKGQVVNIVNDGSSIGFQALDPIVRLNDTLAKNESVIDFLISSDDAYTVFRVNGTHDILYSVDLSTFTVVNLSPTLTVDGSNVVRYAISPDDAYVIYLVDEDVNGIYKLYSVPIGGGIPVDLATTNIGTCGVEHFLTLPDSSRVIYTAQPTETTLDLFSVPITGGVSTQLNNGGSVSGFSVFPDSTHVLYLSDVSSSIELYVVPSAGPAGSSQQVNAALTPGGQVYNSGISPDNGYIIYAADQNTVGQIELFSVTFVTGTSTLGTPTLISGVMVGSIDSFCISTDSAYVVFSADKDTIDKYELYSTPIGGGGTTNLSGVLVAGGDVITSSDCPNFKISLDASTVVFRADKDTDDVIELYSVPITGGATTKLNSVLSSPQNVSTFFISNDSAQVVYLADQDTVGVNELYQVAIGGGSITKLNDTITSGGVQKFGIYPDRPVCDTNSRIVYRLEDADCQIELYSVPYGGGTNVKLNDILTQGGNVSFFIISADCTKVYYTADKNIDEIFQLYCAPIGGFVIGDLVAILQEDTLTGEIGIATLIGPESNITSGLTPGLLYTYSEDGKSFVEYDGTGNRPLGIATSANSLTFNIDLDDQTTTETDPTMCIEGYAQCDMIQGQVAHLCTTGSNISLLPITPLINIDTTSTDYQLTTDYIVYLDTDLYSVDFDTGNSVQLTSISGGSTISSYSVTPDGDYVVFLADTNTVGIPELFQMPIAGGSTTQLNTGGTVTQYDVSPDSSRVVYIADQDTTGQFEIYSVLIDGTSNVKLNGALIPAGDVSSFLITSDSTLVIYNADQLVDGEFNAYKRNIDGSGSDTALTASQTVVEMKLSDDDNYLVYRHNTGTEEELYSVNVTSLVQSQLNIALVAGGTVDSFYISHNSQHVVYTADSVVVGERLLYRVPIAGPLTDSIQINEGIVPSGTDIKISSNDKYVVYIDFIFGDEYLTSVKICGGSQFNIAANVLSFDTTENYVVYISSSGQLISSNYINEVTHNSVYYTLASSASSFQVSDDCVLYLADQDTASLDELYKVSITGKFNVKVNSTTSTSVTDFEISEHDCKRVVYSNGSLNTASFYGSGELLTLGVVQSEVCQNQSVAVKLYGQSNSSSTSLVPGKQYTYNNIGTQLVSFDGSNGYPIGFAISKSRLFLTGGNNYLWNAVDALGTPLNIPDTLVRRDASGGFFASDLGTNNIYPNSDGTYTLGSSSSRWSEIYASGGVVITSDRRSKTNISPCRLSKEFINQLTPVQYQLKNNRENRVHYGFIAQDVKSVVDGIGIDFGGFVESESMYGLKYEEFIAPIIKTLQEQNKEIAQLRQELKDLKEIVSVK